MAPPDASMAAIDAAEARRKELTRRLASGDYGDTDRARSVAQKPGKMTWCSGGRS